jgi:hypothetical protein
MLQELRASLSSRLPSRRPPIAAAEGASEPNSSGPAPELSVRSVTVEAGDASADSAMSSTEDRPTLAGSPASLESPAASPLDLAAGATLQGAAEPLPGMNGPMPGASGNAVALTAEMSARAHIFRRRVMRSTVVVGAVLICGLGWWGYSTNEDLGGARAELATTRTTLTNTRQDLSVATSGLATTRGKLSAAEADLSVVSATLADAQTLTQRQTACITELKGDRDDLQAIAERMRNEVIAPTEPGSVWANAASTQDAALTAMVGDMAGAAVAIYYGAYDAAITYIHQAETDQAHAAAALKTMNGETKKIRASDKATRDQLAAVTQRINATTTCSSN